jgi:23S rRNA (guanosine2251-2'-O)-methyltransferase
MRNDFKGKRDGATPRRRDDGTSRRNDGATERQRESVIPRQRDFVSPSLGHEVSTSVIFGVSPVFEALRSEKRKIDKIYVADGSNEQRLLQIVGLAREKHIPFTRIPRANLSKFVESEANHQGVVAFVAAASYADADELLDEISASEQPLCVVLDGVEDPRNLGAILRTVECAGVNGVFLPDRRAVGLNETVAKSSAGATEYVKVAKVTNLNRLIEDLKSRNIWVVGTSVDTEKSYVDWDWTQPTALVIGGEGKGLHRLVAENCDVLVKIPMSGQIESLNVSVATGVVLFEANRQRSVQVKSKK